MSVCEVINLNVHQGVITAKLFQNTINNWSGMVNLNVPQKKFFGGNISMSEYRTTLKQSSKRKWTLKIIEKQVYYSQGVRTTACTYKNVLLK